MLGIAEVMMETGVTYTLSQRIPFPIFFMNITLSGIVRCGPGTAAGAAIAETVFEHRLTEYGLLEGLRETYGVCVWVCAAMMLLILLTHLRRLPVQLLPRMITVARSLRH